jgi:DNA-binding response OmpR family regulator
VKELLARVEAVLRRCAERPLDLDTITVADGQIDFNRREIRYKNGRRAELSEKEVELVRYLSSNPGRSISREELLANVWRIAPQGVSTRTIDMHITRLREKLHDQPENPRIILTVRGKGYMWGKSMNDEV